MMIDPFQYVDQYKDASYQEILMFKNKLISDITKFEHDYDRKDPNWTVCPSPDVYYQWNLETLGLIAPMLSEAFNREYESGEKNTFDYGKDMKEFLRGNKHKGFKRYDSIKKILLKHDIFYQKSIDLWYNT